MCVTKTKKEILWHGTLHSCKDVQFSGLNET